MNICFIFAIIATCFIDQSEPRTAKLGITVPKALFRKGPFIWTKVFFLTKLDLTKNLRASKFQSGAT